MRTATKRDLKVGKYLYDKNSGIAFMVDYAFGDGTFRIKSAYGNLIIHTDEAKNYNIEEKLSELKIIINGHLLVSLPVNDDLANKLLEELGAYKKREK